MDGWICGWMDDLGGFMDRLVYGRMIWEGLWMDGCVGVWMDGWMGGWMEEWVIGWMDGWMDKWVSGYEGG